MEPRGPQPERFRVYSNSPDGSGFSLPSGEFFLYNPWGGWKDEFGNHYDRRGKPCFDPREVPPELVDSEGESSESGGDSTGAGGDYQPKVEESESDECYSERGEEDNDDGDSFGRSRDSADEDPHYVPKNENDQVSSASPPENLSSKHSAILSRIDRDFAENTHLTFEVTGLSLPEILSIFSNSQPEIIPLEAWEDRQGTVYVLIDKADARDLLGIEMALYKASPLRVFLES